MPTIAQLCKKESVWINYRDASGNVINKIIELDSDQHSRVKEGKPIRITSWPGLIWLIDMPGIDGGLWAAFSMEEYHKLSRIAEMKRAEIVEKEAWRKIISDEENAFHRHDTVRTRRNDQALKEKMPYQRVVVFHNGFETNRRKH